MAAFVPCALIPVVAQVPTDFGDLPDRGSGTGTTDYQTLLAHDGPRHKITALYLGAAVDNEADGQPNAPATGDDAAGATPDDEDGVTIPPLFAGETAIVVVNCSADGRLNAFFDWTNDGDFDDPGETIAELTVVAGNNDLSVVVPASAVQGANLGARFRLSTAGSLTSLGEAEDGEVEDYVVQVTTANWTLDFGDLPDPTGATGPGDYQTFLANNGPRHILAGLRLGAAVDGEGNGLPNATATGDDLSGSTPDDEDGVVISRLIPGQTATVRVNCSGAGKVNAFFDWNNDGDFSDAGETIAELGVVPGNNYLSVAVPASAAIGADLGVRFRLSAAGGLTALGPAADGEVEDYLVRVHPPSAAVGNLIWLDENSDGYQDAGEPGIPNVHVNLYDASGALIAKTFTDSQGGYLFGGLKADIYYVDVLDGTGGQDYTLPFPGMTQTPPGTLPGADFGNQSHSTTPIPGGGLRTGYRVALGPDDEQLTADFGYNYNQASDVNGNAHSAALGDRVWIDYNANGTQTWGEVGVQGATLQLYTAGPDGFFGTADDVAGVTTITDANGYYLFDGLPPGAYVVKVVSSSGASHDILGSDHAPTGDPDHFGRTGALNDNQTTTPVVLGPGEVFLNADFGYGIAGTSQVGNIWAYVSLDADADGINDDGFAATIPGLTVTLIKDTNGNRAWDSGEPIIATASDVEMLVGGYQFYLHPFDGLAGSDNGDGDPSDADYLVWVNDTDNVLASLRATYDDLPPPNGLSAHSLTPGMSTVVLAAVGYTPAEHQSGKGLIGDAIWLDNGQGGGNARDGLRNSGEPGIEGVLLELYDTAGNMLVATTRTDENGSYWFGGLDPTLSYTVIVAASNFSAGSVLEGTTNTGDPDGGLDSQSVVNLGAAGSDGNADPDGLNNDINLGQDFGYTAPLNQAGSIGNLIWLDQNADGIGQGVNGPDGILGTDDDESGQISSDLRVDLYRDLNGNGMVDPGEPRIATTFPNFTGGYLFPCLPLVGHGDADPQAEYIVDVVGKNESFTVVRVVTTGYWHSLSPNQDPNTSGGNDPNDNSKTDPFAVEIGSGAGGQPVPNNLNVDFGYYVEAAALGNRVWLDSNRNGLQDAGETGLANVIVTLKTWYLDGTLTTLNTTTDANGLYSFGNLLQDEDYNGDGVGPEPVFSVSVDINPANNPALAGLEPTLLDQGGNDKLDADPPRGVIAQPVKGLTDVTSRTPPSGEPTVASYDFGFRTAPPPTAALLGSFSAVHTSDGRVLLSWRTLVEVGTLGFRLERSTADGGWEAAFDDIIPAGGADWRPHDYSIEDTLSVGAGELRYRLVVIDLRGDERVLAEALVAPAVEVSLERTGTGHRLTVRGTAEGHYVAEMTTELTSGVWRTVETVRLDTTGSGAVALPLNGDDGQRFYRVRSE